MTEIVRLLLVEDNPQEQEEWKNTIQRQNVRASLKANVNYVLTVVSTLEEARAKIELCDFDAGIVDLRLAAPGKESMDRSGNEVLDILLQSELAAIAMFTGEPSGADIPSYAKAQVKVFTKGGEENEGTSAVLNWLISETPMIICVRRAQKEIKKEMARFFFHSVWPRWSNWLEEPSIQNEDFLATAMARHITSHVYASLLEKFKQRAHPEEWYVVPPIHETLRTGDIVRHANGTLEVVITPRCDLATGKVESIQLAVCDDESLEWGKMLSAIEKYTAEQNAHTSKGEKIPDSVRQNLEKAQNKQRAFTQHRSKSSLHFLPPMKLSQNENIGPFMVRFDLIRSIPVNGDDAKSMLQKETRVASVASEFLPSMVERLGTFFSRIGTPDYSHV
ncbi:hypothetical protein [Variovorax paradoxus]|uniref:hypothetical protein n=1 Tax=Variovorax paradoxus TaxID=34073 RepID=UPI0012D3AF2D|nr:hypothetical protein [Variovorax paradoxus]